MTFRFENQVVDLGRRELVRAGAPVDLEPRIFDLLVYLIENRDRLVTKDDLIAHVWRGRIVSDSALTSAINGARKALGDSGEEQRLIRTVPKKGLRFVGSITGVQPSLPSADLPLPDKPSVAVLPFTNMSSDPDQEYFADGIVDDIIAALSRFKSLFVIARNSSFIYKGRPVDIRQVARELGVRYVLEGSVRKSNGRVRVTGQLLDSQTGGHLWADRFDGNLEDVFALQDRITAEVACQLVQKIEQTEIERLGTRPATTPGAYESHLLGMKCLHRSTRESVEDSLRHYYRAIDLDPEFADPYAWASIAYTRQRQGQWMADIRRECKEGIRLGRQSVELRDDDPLTLCAAGFALAYLGGEIEAGLGFLERALVLNPNSALTWHGASWVRLYNGEHDLAIDHLARAARLSPLDPQTAQFQVAAAWAHCCAGRFEEAAASAERAVQRHPDLVIALVAFCLQQRPCRPARRRKTLHDSGDAAQSEPQAGELRRRCGHAAGERPRHLEEGHAPGGHAGVGEAGRERRSANHVHVAPTRFRRRPELTIPKGYESPGQMFVPLSRQECSVRKGGLADAWCPTKRPWRSSVKATSWRPGWASPSASSLSRKSLSQHGDVRCGWLSADTKVPLAGRH